MLNPSMRKSEIETFLKDKGEFVQIDYLTKLLLLKPSLDLKRFIYLKLAQIYENRGMLNDAAKTYNNLALISIAFTDKIKYYTKETKLHIKNGYFSKADESLQRAISEARADQKQEIYSFVANYYLKLAEQNENELKRGKASRIYEKLLTMELNFSEIQEIKKRLLKLYEKLGKLDEYYELKKEFED